MVYFVVVVVVAAAVVFPFKQHSDYVANGNFSVFNGMNLFFPVVILMPNNK